MISYGSAIAAGARCLRTQDPGAALGSAMAVCGQPVAGGPGLRARYCPACVARLTAPRRYEPRVPRGPAADAWSPPTLEEWGELAELPD